MFDKYNVKLWIQQNNASTAPSVTRSTPYPTDPVFSRSHLPAPRPLLGFVNMLRGSNGTLDGFSSDALVLIVPSPSPASRPVGSNGGARLESVDVEVEADACVDGDA